MKAYRLNKNRFLLVSHPHYPSRFPYFNRLYALICFHIGTINLAFRRVRVCVCLVGFASLQSPWAHTLRHPCLACSSRCTEPFHSRNLLKNTSTASSRTMSLPPLSKVRCCHPKKFGRLPEGLPNHLTSLLTNPSKTPLFLSLFVGEWACPSRNIIVIIKNDLIELLCKM